jgi:hypothetical protein
MASGRVQVCPRSSVLRINAQKARADSVTVLQDGLEVDLAARVIVVANGAYFAPVLLLNSAKPLAGRTGKNDQVGRNLMFRERRLAWWRGGAGRMRQKIRGFERSVPGRDLSTYGT